jgi:hypothetical protein
VLEGQHKIIIEKRGYTVLEKTIAVDPSKLLVLTVAMTSSLLGWVEIASNVSGADIFIDDTANGAVGRTPLWQSIGPGRHTVWVSGHGYEEYRRVIDVKANEVSTIKAPLKGAPVSRLTSPAPGSTTPGARAEAAPPISAPSYRAARSASQPCDEPQSMLRPRASSDPVLVQDGGAG